jgi:hypothetical protein
MGKHVELDLDTYNNTKGLSGGPIVTVTEKDVPFISPATDELGNVTRSGAIAYGIAYALMAAAVGYWIFVF